MAGREAANRVGCQIAQEVGQAQEQRMQSVVGLAIAEFTGQAGLTPVSEYPSRSGRVFVASGKSMTFVTTGSYDAPTDAGTAICRVHQSRRLTLPPLGHDAHGMASARIAESRSAVSRRKQ